MTSSQPNRPTPPNITEGARRAWPPAEIVDAINVAICFAPQLDNLPAGHIRPLIDRIFVALQPFASALDSAHPAPKEGGETNVSQLIQDAIADHIAEYEKTFPEQAWGRGSLHARLFALLEPVVRSLAREAEALNKENDRLCKENNDQAERLAEAKRGLEWQPTVKDLRARLTQAEKLLGEAAAGCPTCGGIGVVHTMEDETQIGEAPGSSKIPCPSCSRIRAHLAQSKTT